MRIIPKLRQSVPAIKQRADKKGADMLETLRVALNHEIFDVYVNTTIGTDTQFGVTLAKTLTEKYPDYKFVVLTADKVIKRIIVYPLSVDLKDVISKMVPSRIRTPELSPNGRYTTFNARWYDPSKLTQVA